MALSFARTNIVATISSRDITNRNQPLLFFHMDPTNNIAWTRKGFTGSVRSHVGWVWGKTWVEISDGALSFVRTNIVATISSRDITNRNQPLLFLHMDPSNNIAWT
jgi:L-arabinose isomerase